MRGGERGERDGERVRCTDRQTEIERQTHRQIERQTDRQTEIERQTHGQIERQTDR